jgi:hypothetical protein
MTNTKIALYIARPPIDVTTVLGDGIFCRHKTSLR